MGLLQKILLENQWLLSFLLLPISFFYDMFWFARSKYVLWRGSAPLKHAERVRYVQRQVRDWQKEGRGRKMCTARPQWMSITSQKLNYKETSYQVEVNLMDILEIDTERRVVRVEPMVTIGRLVEALWPRGWTVPIVPEIGDLTIGGLVMGGGIESTSHKYGVWHNICTKFELVLADGSHVECEPKGKNSDIYWAVPWSYGTIGFLTAIEIMIVPYKPFMKLVYEPTFSLEKTVEVFQRETRKDKSKMTVVDENDNDSVEAIAFSKDTAVVMTGTFVDEVEDGAFVNNIGRWYKPWFYTHVRGILERGDKVVEFIPTKDFFFRHNKPYFWLADTIVPFGNVPIFRYLLGWLLPYNYSLLKFFNTLLLDGTRDADDNIVVQDFGIPSRFLADAIRFYHAQLEIYPLWLCPAKAFETGPVETIKDEDTIFVDIGIYGFCKKPGFRKYDTIRRLENFAIEHNGYQVYLTYEDMNKMFDGRHYRRMRKELPLTEEAFPEIYDKISKLGRSTTSDATDADK